MEGNKPSRGKIKDEAITAANTLNSAIGLYMLEGDYAKISPHSPTHYNQSQILPMSL